jgi:hypothetical protein
MIVNIELNYHTVMIIALAAGALAHIIRMEMRISEQSKEIDSLRLQVSKGIDALKLEVSKEFSDVKSSHELKERAIWDKIESVHSILLSLVQGLGRLEGKIDKKS